MHHLSTYVQTVVEYKMSISCDRIFPTPKTKTKSEGNSVRYLLLATSIRYHLHSWSKRVLCNWNGLPFGARYNRCLPIKSSDRNAMALAFVYWWHCCGYIMYHTISNPTLQRLSLPSLSFIPCQHEVYQLPALSSVLFAFVHRAQQAFKPFVLLSESFEA